MSKKKKNQQILLFSVLAVIIIVLVFQIALFNRQKISLERGQVGDNDIPLTKPKTQDIFYQDTSGLAYDVCIAGDYAYLAAGYAGLAVIDISDPTNPGTPIYEDTTGDAYGLCISGDYAYLAVGDSGLAVIDISDPTNPGTPVYEGVSGIAYDVYISGDYAYVADLTTGLAVIDISNPIDPSTPVYASNMPGSYGVCVIGDFAYTADGSSGLRVIDISNPTSPGTPVSEDTTGIAYDVCVSGDYAYLAVGDSGLAVIDISNPTNPGTPVYEITTGDARDVCISGNYAYLADLDYGLAVIDISDPTNPGTPVYATNLVISEVGSCHAVTVEGDYAYLTIGYDGMAIIKIGEIIDPESPFYEDTSGYASMDVCVSGDYAYIADYDGLAVIDISDPTNPGAPVYEGTTGNAYGVCISGDYAYIADYNSGLAVMDISNPTNPGAPVYEDTIGSANDVDIAGDYAYLAIGGSGFAVIDISDPTNPSAPVYEGGLMTRSVNVVGDFAYVAAWGWGLGIYDISNPLNPGAPYRSDTYGSSRDVCIRGNYAYVADYNYGLAIIDISDPTNPGAPVYESTSANAIGVDISGDYAYVACVGSGLAVIDISDPTNPGTPIYEDTLGSAQKVSVVGEYAYIADFGEGLAISKIMEPWYLLEVTVLNSISPDPDYDGIINLGWSTVTGATEYKVFRDISEILLLSGRTPIATVPGITFQDTLASDNLYYYAVVAANTRGTSFLSNSESVNVLIDNQPPGSFSIYSPTVWESDQTPTVICQFYTDKSGVDVSSVQYAYSTSGETAPSNWAGVNGVYINDVCTILASDGSTGWLYAKVNAVPFNQDSETLNTIRFRAIDLANNLGTQSTATVIQIDSSVPGSFSIYSPTEWVTDQSPTVIGQFYIDKSGVDISTVQCAYSTNGDSTPDNWAGVNGVYINDICTISASDGSTGWLYTKVNAVPFNQDSETQNTIRFRARNMVGFQGVQGTASIIKVDSVAPSAFSLHAPTDWVTDQTPTVVALFYAELSGVDISTVEYAYSISGETAPNNWAGVNGVYINDICTIPASDGTIGWLYAKVNAVPFNQDSETQNTIRFQAKDIAGNPSSQGSAVIIKVDSTAPHTFSIYYPEDQVEDQTPTVICQFYITLSGIDISTVEYACSTSGETTPDNWELVDGIYTNSECTIHANDGDTGWLYAKVNTVPFDQESMTLNTIRFRATDMASNQGTQDVAVEIPIAPKASNDIWYFVIFGSIIIGIASIISLVLVRKSIKGRGIRVFISHAVKDNQKYQIEDLAEYLQSQKGISKVHYCEAGMVGNIDDWMDTTVPRSQLLIIFVTENSVESKDCIKELSLAFRHNIQIMPILGENMEWEKLEKKLEVFNISREFGKEFYSEDFSKFREELYEYVMRVKQSLEEEISAKKRKSKAKKLTK